MTAQFSGTMNTIKLLHNIRAEMADVARQAAIAKLDQTYYHERGVLLNDTLTEIINFHDVTESNND